MKNSFVLPEPPCHSGIGRWKRVLGLFRLVALVVVMPVLTVAPLGCQRSSRDESERIQHEINTRTLKTDSLRQGLRYLAQTTPHNQGNLSTETRVTLNTWLKSADASQIPFTSSKLLAGLDPQMLAHVGCEKADSGQFNLLDIDFLYQCNLMKHLSSWIVQGPVHDRLLKPILGAKLAKLGPDEAATLERAFKLFDWTMRNIKLAGVESSQVTVKTRDPRAPLSDDGVGYTTVPWQTALFSSGDFISRGRVFTALAAQQGIETCWISLGAPPGQPGDLFAIGVLVGGELLLFEPKLGMPLLDPDTDSWATLKDASSNERVLRRLNLPQYEYAFDLAAIHSVQLLVEAIPFSGSLRAKLLEQSLTGDERMVVSVDLDALTERLSKAVPNATVSIWQTPLLAQLYSISLRDRLKQTSEFSMRYYGQNAIWLMDTPVSQGRLLHLNGKFESTLDGQGALKTYMAARLDDESLQRLAYNPDVQKAMGLVRRDGESRESFEARIRQTQGLFARAKFDVAFLLAQLHFDRGDYDSCVYWLEDRVLNDERSSNWHAPGWYTLARAYVELDKTTEAQDALTKPTIDSASQIPAYVVSPHDAGNRIRLRYLRRGDKNEATQ